MKLKKKKKKKNDHDHDKYITTQEFNKLTSENFAPILAQANLASKNDIANFVNKTDFDDELKSLTKKVISNKTGHIEVRWSRKKVKIILTKKLIADMINKYSILNRTEYFSSNGFKII